jgi:hypothetical protein
MIKGWKNKPEWVKYYEDKKALRINKEMDLQEISLEIEKYRYDEKVRNSINNLNQIARNPYGADCPVDYGIIIS